MIIAPRFSYWLTFPEPNNVASGVSFNSVEPLMNRRTGVSQLFARPPAEALVKSLIGLAVVVAVVAGAVTLVAVVSN